MNPGVLEDDENADDEDQVADDLSDGVLERAVEAASHKIAIEEEALCSRRDPKNREHQGDQEKKLEQAQRDSGERRSPKQRDASGVNRADREENECRRAQDRGDDRNEICVEFEPGEEPPDEFALEGPGEKKSRCEKASESYQPEERNVMIGDVKNRPFKHGVIHSSVWADEKGAQPETPPRAEAPNSKVRPAALDFEVRFRRASLGIENKKGTAGRRAFPKD